MTPGIDQRTDQADAVAYPAWQPDYVEGGVILRDDRTLYLGEFVVDKRCPGFPRSRQVGSGLKKRSSRLISQFRAAMRRFRFPAAPPQNKQFVRCRDALIRLSFTAAARSRWPGPG